MAKTKENRKYILSIDIDYILEPFIDYVEAAWTTDPFYAVQANNDNIDHPTSVFERQHALAPLIEKVGEISQQNFKEVMDVFSSALFQLKKSEPNKIYFADNHDTILTPLERIWNDTDQYERDKTKFTIVNLDHHHDIYYSEKQRVDVDKYNLVSPGDWVWFLDKYGLCDSYHWIGNKNSSDFIDLAGTGVPTLMKKGTKSTSLQEFIDRGKMPKKFDLIYVCSSPHWTPEYFLDYFKILKDMAENYFGCKLEQDKGYYCGGRYSKPWGRQQEEIVKEDSIHIKSIDETRSMLSMIGGQEPSETDDN
tara:strand:- start:1605 stop:2525 length:921 start_codon:yes stop_codon:yes gene_type:complete